MTNNKTLTQKNEALANDLKKFLFKNMVGEDVRIYFNNQAYDFKSPTIVELMENIKGTTYFEYANDETVSMSFEGNMYHILNYGESPSLLKKFDAIFEKHNCYYEFGYAWSLSVYYD